MLISAYFVIHFITENKKKELSFVLITETQARPTLAKFIKHYRYMYSVPSYKLTKL